MSIKAAFIAYETTHNTNPLIAALRAAGVKAKDPEIIKTAEKFAAPYEAVPGNSGNKPLRSNPERLEQRADEFVAAIAKL